MLILLVACTELEPGTSIGFTTDGGPGPTGPEAPTLTSRAEIARPASPSVWLVRRLVAATDRPTRATVVISDGARAREIVFPEVTTDHDLPLYGLRADTSYVVDATFTDALGGAVEDTVTFDSGPNVDTLPDIELVYADPTRREPGYVVFPEEVDSKANVVAVDAEGEVVGTWESASPTTRALAFDAGVFSAIYGNSVMRWTPLGEVEATWTTSPGLPNAIQLPIDGIHHEFAFEPDGSFWSFHKLDANVLDFPTSEADPTSTGPARVAFDAPIHFAADGSILHDWPLIDRLDPNRIGYNSLDVLPNGDFDWTHGNSIFPVPDQGAVLISLRHQDAIIKLGLPDGDIRWILGNHDGWDPEFAQYLLEPVGELVWPYHQHAPMVGADGRIVLFDNGNLHRTTPYSQAPEPGRLYSRIVQYEVDETTMQVTQTFSSVATQSPVGGGYVLYSSALGNADVLPVTGNFFATFPYLHTEGGVRNESVGIGDRSVRLVEVDAATGDTVWDLRVNTPLSESPTGLLVDRAIHVPSLYPPTVTERWLP